MAIINKMVIPVTDGQGTITNEEIEFESSGGSANYYGTCTGQAANQIKAVTISSDQGFELKTGVLIFVKFDANNSYNATTSNPIKLNANNTGAKQIYASNTATPEGTNTTFFGKMNCINQYVYNGTYWVWNGTSSEDEGSGLPNEVITYEQFKAKSDSEQLAYTGYVSGWPGTGGGGSVGILPHLIVISETGSTVTATKGQTVITATETSTGHFECDLTELGTWTIDAILGGDDAQVSLVVDTVKVYTVDDSHFHATVTVKYPSGATCRLQSADETLYATGSPYTFTVHHAETYTITVTYNQRIHTDTVTFTTEGQSFSKTLPSPSEVDANDINLWLFFGDVSGTFSSLAEILANSTALLMLMASTDAVDYLVKCKDWIKSEGLVPVMTSDTMPSGQALSNSVLTGNNAYKAFDNDTSTIWGANHVSSAYIGYDFGNPVVVNKIYRLGLTSSDGTTTKRWQYRIKYSDDGTNWNNIDDTYTNFSTSLASNQSDTIVISNSIAHRYWAMEIKVADNSTSTFNTATLQFYSIAEGVTDNQSAMSYIGLNNYCANTLLADSDWCESICNSEYFESVLNVKVPAMTSNTTPSGECSAVNSYSGTAPWYAFDDNNTSYWMSNSQSQNAWVQYKFAEKHKILVAFIKTRLSSGGGTNWRLANFIIQSSYDNFATHKNEYTGTMPRDTNGELKVIIPDSNEADIWRLHGIDTYQDSISVITVQFYGRADV